MLVLAAVILLVIGTATVVADSDVSAASKRCGRITEDGMRIAVSVVRGRVSCGRARRLIRAASHRPVPGKVGTFRCGTGNTYASCTRKHPRALILGRLGG